MATIDLPEHRRRALHPLVVVHDYVRARKGQGYRPAYPAGQTGDQRCLPQEVEAEGGGDAVVALSDGGDGRRAPYDFAHADDGKCGGLSSESARG